MDPVVDLLRELVAIDSVNPSLVEGGAGEAAIAQCIGQWMRRAGFDVRVDEIAPGRVNVVAIAEGAGDGPTRMLCGHTIPSAWTAWPRRLLRTFATDDSTDAAPRT